MTTATTPASPTPTPIKHRERELLIAGTLLWLALGTFIALVWLADAAQARALMAGLLAELAAGREAGIPVGLAAGASPWLVWPVSASQDLGTALLGYPVFLYLLHRFQDSDRYLMRRLRSIETKAAKNKAYIEKWGPIGVGLFMLIPFLVNGPYIALVLGRLAGIRTPRLIAPVVVATIVTAGLWTFFFDRLMALLENVHPDTGWYVAGGTATVVVTVGIADFIRETLHERNRSAASDSEE